MVRRTATSLATENFSPRTRTLRKKVKRLEGDERMVFEVTDVMERARLKQSWARNHSGPTAAAARIMTQGDVLSGGAAVADINPILSPDWPGSTSRVSSVRECASARGERGTALVELTAGGLKTLNVPWSSALGLHRLHQRRYISRGD